MLDGLLEKDPAKRLSAKKALRHRLFNLVKIENHEQSRQLVRDNLRFKGLGRRKRMNVVKRGVLLFIATRLLPDHRYQELIQLFQTVD